MTTEQFFEQKGYKCYPQVCDWPVIVNNVWQKRIDNERVCETNDKLFINIKEWQMEEYKDNPPPKYTIEIVAEYNKLWWQLGCYSLSEQELIEKHDEIVEILIKLFNTI